MIERLLPLSQNLKKLLLVALDAFLIFFSATLSFSIRLGEWYIPNGEMIFILLSAPIIALPIYYFSGIYQVVVRFFSFRNLWLFIKVISISALLWGIYALMFALDSIIESEIVFPRSVVFIHLFISIILTTSSRIIARWILLKKLIPIKLEHHQNPKIVLIYGAGISAVQLMSSLDKSNRYFIVGFIDDIENLQGRYIDGIRVFPSSQIEGIIATFHVEEIFIAISPLSRRKRKNIIDSLEKYQIKVRILPDATDLADGSIKIQDLKEVSIEDLLGRDPVPNDRELLAKTIKGKVVLVTGAGGSIGSEICRQVVLNKPKGLILLEHNELALYNINQELEGSKVKIYPILGSVVNKQKVAQILSQLSVDTLYHAAAYKHVPLVELNNTEGVVNNVFGTLNVAKAAIKFKVKTFVLISTDKAVRPTNTMGASKRCAEMLVQALSKSQSSTKFSMVRFGNVLGSSGSVIPLFKNQIQNGGPITVTDKKIVRYFMTVSEAVELVIQAGAMAKGGDVFVLDMGIPVSIDKLAKKMIKLSGLELKDDNNPNGDIEIIYTGLRPGEKLFEELLIDDNAVVTQNKRIRIAQDSYLEWNDLSIKIKKLSDAIKSQDEKLMRDVLIEIVPSFNPQSKLIDIYKK